MEGKTFVHLNPVWHEKADFIIGARVASPQDPDIQGWEQLWSRQTAPDRFELCCVPFFVYNLALGDEVETDSELAIARVVRPSGHYTFRVWFCDSSEPNIRQEVIAQVYYLKGLPEWYSHNLLAIDMPQDQAQAIADFLYEQEQMGHLMYEAGCTLPSATGE